MRARARARVCVCVCVCVCAPGTYDSLRSSFIRDFRTKLIFSGFIYRPIE